MFVGVFQVVETFIQVNEEKPRPANPACCAQAFVVKVEFTPVNPTSEVSVKLELAVVAEVMLIPRLPAWPIRVVSDRFDATIPDPVNVSCPVKVWVDFRTASPCPAPEEPHWPPVKRPFCHDGFRIVVFEPQAESVAPEVPLELNPVAFTVPLTSSFVDGVVESIPRLNVVLKYELASVSKNIFVVPLPTVSPMKN